MDLLTLLTLGNFAFTAGAYGFTWQVYKLVNNHRVAEIKALEKRVAHLEGRCLKDCPSCDEIGVK